MGSGEMTTAAAQRVHRVVGTPDPAGLLYGALVAASVLATASLHSPAFTRVALATTAVLGIYWLAHVYIAAQTLQVAGDARHFIRRLAHTGVHEAAVIEGGLPAVSVYVVVNLAGATSQTAATVAVWFSVAVLTAAGFVNARRAGRHGLVGLVDAAAAGAFGVLVIVAKAALH